MTVSIASLRRNNSNQPDKYMMRRHYGILGSPNGIILETCEGSTGFGFSVASNACILFHVPL
jgi:hypothetical protein